MSAEQPRCPSCGRPLGSLKQICTDVMEYMLGEDGCYDEGREVKTECGKFVCPYCGATIAEDETHAIMFLRGQWKPEAKGNAS